MKANLALNAASPSPVPVDHRLSVAPMMEWTTPEFRYLVRLISRRTLLFTEMVVAQAVLHGPREQLLAYDADEHPVIFQLGGSDPDALAEASRIIADYGYDGINLNVCCPSNRVQKGNIGAVLMKHPEQVATCIEAMRQAVSLPISVKSRSGVDDQDDYAFLHRFVSLVSNAGCDSFAVHARKAYLKGLSPKENRTVPPLQHDRASQLKKDFPHLSIQLNGGITDLDEACSHLGQVDGVMIGRAAYHNTWLLAEADTRIFGETSNPLQHPKEVIEAYLPYLQRRYAAGMPVKHALRHLLGLFQGLPGARRYRRHLSENMCKADAKPSLLREAANLVNT